MQNIVMHLVFQDFQLRSLNDFSFWLDNDHKPLDEVLSRLEAQQHRRCIKTHLPLDGLPYFPALKYIVVGRDGRDVFMSLWNHYRNFLPAQYEHHQGANPASTALPPCPADIRDFWQAWISQGWFDWETEGYPFWSNFRHGQTWWDYRHLPNILFVHFNDLLADLPGEVGRIAAFLEIPLADDMAAAIAAATSFDSMKALAPELLPGATDTWVGGARTFINKGTNGRWREVLTAADLLLYDAAVTRELSADCAAWLEQGRLLG
jgi:aryl sulfotransferase